MTDFIVWGVRNGFEVIMSSNNSITDLLRKDVVTDNMRQVCNGAYERFYSIHRTLQYHAVTIYHPDTKDMVGRKAYISITFCSPIGKQFSGPVLQVLNKAMDFYLMKQGTAKVNMFTADMMHEQLAGIETVNKQDKQTFGTKLGYWKYSNEQEISAFFELLNIEGYKSVYFVPVKNSGIEQQLAGHESVSQFQKLTRVTLLSYDASRFAVYHNNRPVTGNTDRLEIDGVLDDVIVIDEISSGRQKRIAIKQSDEMQRLSAMFPAQQASGGGGRPGNNKSNTGGLTDRMKIFIGAVSLLLLAIVATWLILSETGNDPGTEVVGDPPLPYDSTSISPNADSNTVSANEIDTTISMNDLLLLTKLNTKQRTALSNVKVEGVTIGKISTNGDSVRLQINTSKKTTEIINLIGTYFDQKMKEGEDAEIPKNNSVNNQNKDTAGSSVRKFKKKKDKVVDPCTEICNKLKDKDLPQNVRDELQANADSNNCPCN